MPDEPALPDATATASHEGVSAADDAPLGPRAGDRIGRYVVERELGAGGMGVVVEAHNPELARRVALKLVRPDVGDRAYRQRLVQEARAMAQLEHPNVVVLDAKAQGGHLDGLDYAITAARAAGARTDAEQQVVLDAAAGDALVRAQRFDDARALCEPALGRADQALGPGDVARDDALVCMADLSSRSGRQADALRFASREVGEQVARYGPRHPLVADALHNYGVTLDHSGDVRDELVVRWCAHALIVEQQGPDAADAGDSWAGLAIALAQTDDHAAARAALDRANAILPAALAKDDPRLVTFRSMRAYTLDGIGDHEAALAAYADLERDLEGVRPTPIDLAIVTINYSDALRAAHRCPEALPIDDRVTALITALPKPLTIFVEGARAGCRLDAGRAAEAVRDLGAAWAAIAPGELAPPDRGQLELILAHALDAGGGDRARALAIARAAKADLGAQAPPELAPLIARLSR